MTLCVKFQFSEVRVSIRKSVPKQGTCLLSQQITAKERIGPPFIPHMKILSHKREKKKLKVFFEKN